MCSSFLKEPFFSNLIKLCTVDLKKTIHSMYALPLRELWCKIFPFMPHCSSLVLIGLNTNCYSGKLYIILRYFA